MKVKELREALEAFPDDMEVMTKKNEVFGNIGYVFYVEKSSYGFFGTDIDCVLLTDCSENWDECQARTTGDWIQNHYPGGISDGCYKCSVCGYESEPSPPRICPNCNSIMNTIRVL